MLTPCHLDSDFPTNSSNISSLKIKLEDKVTSDNGYESGSVSRESAADSVRGHCTEWPQVRSVAVGASLDDILSIPEHSYRDLTSPLPPVQFDDETLMSPMTTLCYDPPFDHTFRASFLEDQRFSQDNKRFKPNTGSTPARDTTDYQTLMRLCGDGDANALDSFLSVKPESLKRTGDAYLGVMADIKNSMRVTSSDSVTVTEPQVIISPIVSAIMGGNSECVRLLVEAGASVNSPGGITDNMCARADCPLSCSLRVDRMDVAEYLVSQGACVGEALMRLAGCTDKRLANMLGVRLGSNVNVVESRDPDIQALWRLISQQILILTPAPLESAFLLGRAFKLLACVRPPLTSHWERLGTACERFSIQLIDQCLSTQEVTAIMSREESCTRQSAPIHDALYYGRNEFVSHPATYRTLQQRITRSKSARPQLGDIVLSLLSPILLPLFSVISYILCGIRRDSLLRKYMYRVYAPFGIFSTMLLADILFLVLVACCSIYSSDEADISVLEIITWSLGLGILVSEIERRKLIVWYYQFRFVCNLLIFTWLISIFLIELLMYTTPDWKSGSDAVQILYGVMLVTLSVRLLSIIRPLIPCNPLCVINQLIPDFFSYLGVLGSLYIVFNVAIHAVYKSTSPYTYSVSNIYNVLFLSLQRVVNDPGNPNGGNIAGQLLFILWLIVCLLTFLAFAINSCGKIQSSRRHCEVERKCSTMRLIMMYEANHPVPPPFNLFTWPLTLLCRNLVCAPCKTGIKHVVWGDEEQSFMFDTGLHDKQEHIARVCSRLKPSNKDETKDQDSYEAVMCLREDLYKLYGKLDAEGIKLDALQAVWSSFVNLQDNLASLQSQVKGLVTDSERNNTLLTEQTDRVLGISKLLESKEFGRRSAGSGASSGGRFSDI